MSRLRLALAQAFGCGSDRGGGGDDRDDRDDRDGDGDDRDDRDDRDGDGDDRDGGGGGGLLPSRV